MIKVLDKPNLSGAKYTLAVPAYLYDKGLKSFSDIAKFGPELDNKIFGNVSQPTLGIPHGCRRIAIYRPKISLPVHQRIAQRERLRHTYEGVVKSGIPMGMKPTHALADHLGAFHLLAIVQQAHVIHVVQETTVHWLQAIADVGQRPADDHRHRIVEIRSPHLLFNVDRLNIRSARAAALARW